MSQPAEGWAVYGIDFPEDFVFPVTTLGFAADVHGGGGYGTSPTRVDCHAHIERGSSRLEIIPKANPHTDVEADVAWQFGQQFPLTLWLYRSLPCRIETWPPRRQGKWRFTASALKTPRATAPVAWSLRNETLADFRQFSQALLDFHEDRQVYFVARQSPDVLEEDDIVRVLCVGRRDDANAHWLDAHWHVMAATDLYERARTADDPDIEFLLLLIALEVLFNDGGSELSRRLAHRCALLNGRDPNERKALSEKVNSLYKHRSHLVHGDLVVKRRFRELPTEDLLLAGSLVRVSLLRLVALGHAKKDVIESLDSAIFNPREADELRAEAERYWETRGVDIASLFKTEGAAGRD